MKNYIFFTSEGYTFDNSNKPTKNLQILGDAQGLDLHEAFESFKVNQSYLYSQDYKHIMAIETKGEAIRGLEL